MSLKPIWRVATGRYAENALGTGIAMMAMGVRELTVTKDHMRVLLGEDGQEPYRIEYAELPGGDTLFRITRSVEIDMAPVHGELRDVSPKRIS